MMFRRTMKGERNCANDDEKVKENQKKLWEWWWSILISDSAVTAPQPSRPILTILSFVAFALIDLWWRGKWERLWSWWCWIESDAVDSLNIVKNWKKLCKFPKSLKDNFLTTQKNNSIRGVLFHNDRDDDGLFPGGLKHMLPLHINNGKEK